MSDDREYPVSIRNLYFQIKVTDLERAKKFYEDVFNFDVSWYMGPEGGWCEMWFPGKVARLGLNLVEEDHEYLPNSGVLTFDVSDIEATKKYFEGKDIETTDIVDIPKMVSFFNIKDSEGNSLQIVTDPRIND
ncbi:MAG: VOC family protein [Candidatus Heimdallarchaeaceae archaeon]